MSDPLRQQRLAALRDTIADIERKPALAEARMQVSAAETDDFPMPAGGLLQEVFSDDHRQASAALGFALAQAKSLLSQQRLAVIYLQMSKDAQELGLPYGPGLVSFGFEPDALVLVRTASMAELLWAAEEALACRAVAAVVADIGRPAKILDFTASRRLSLRAASSGSSIFLLRYGLEREASAAQLRWRLMAQRSGRKRFDHLAPGPLRWQAQLEKGVLRKQQTEWLLGWTHDGLATITAAPHPNAQRSPAFPRPYPAELAHGLSQTA